MGVSPRVWIGALAAVMMPAGAWAAEVEGDVHAGWQQYNRHCQQCHAPDGVGSTFAPSLIERLLPYDEFHQVVAEGREAMGPTGVSVMPPFGDVEPVMEHMEDIYAYIAARAEGDLERGEPERQ